MRWLPSLVALSLALAAAAASLAAAGSVPARPAASPVTVADPGVPPGSSQHPPIEITDIDGMTIGSGIRSGLGTAASPYIVSGWMINAAEFTFTNGIVSAYVFEDGIRIHDTGAYIVVENDQISGAPRDGILIQNAPHVEVLNNAVQVFGASGSSGSSVPCTVASTASFPFLGQSCPGGASGGIVLQNAPNAVVSGNTIQVMPGPQQPSVVGISVSGGNAVDVDTNTVRSSAIGIRFTGLSLQGTVGATVSSNFFEETTGHAPFTGVVGEDISQSTFAGNTVQADNPTGPVVGLQFYEMSFSRVTASSVLSSLTGGSGQVPAGSYGIVAEAGGQNVFSGNQVSSRQTGMVLVAEIGDSLARNSFTSNTYGFGMFGSGLAQLSSLVDRSNTVNGKPIVLLRNLANTVVDGNALGPYSYLGIVNASNVVVQNVSVTGEMQGLLLAGFNNGSARNLSVRADWAGVDLSASTGTRVTEWTGNLFSWDSNYCTIDNGTLQGSGTATVPPPFQLGANLSLGSFGVWLFGSTHTTLDHLSGNADGVGILLEVDSNGIGGFALVEHSSLDGNQYGAWVERTAGDSLQGNAIYQNAHSLVFHTRSPTAPPLDARLDWWGSPSGPGGSITTYGGGSVSTSPWLTAAPADAGNVR